METKDIETQIKEIKAEILSAIGTDQTKIAAMQTQLDALDVKLAERHTGDDQGSSLKKVLEESDGAQRMLRDKKGQAVITIPSRLLERKTTLTAAGQGFQSTGVMQIDRIPGITAEARQELMIRDALTSRPTTLGYVDFVKVQTPLTVPSPPQVEAQTKFENTVAFLGVSEKVRTIATTLPASRQILDDFSELLGFLQTGLSYYVDLAEEIEILSGDGTGEHLHGLIPQSTAFNTGLLSAIAGWNKIDIVGRAIQQLTAAKEFQPTFIVLHPNDWWGMRLTKDAYGNYILGNPLSGLPSNLFNLTVISTTSITSGTFLIGSGRPEASELRDRMDTVVEISTQHSDFFAKNLLMLRAERRTALCVKRPGSYVSGTFTTSP